MTDPSPSRVLLLHGLWMPRASMRWLASRLQAAGFQPSLFGYSSVAGGPEAVTPQLIQQLREPAHVVAHSLGGLMALTALQAHPELPVERVVCLGSPLCGSRAASALAGMPLAAATLGRSADLLRRGCAPWAGRQPVGVIAGSLPMGFGQFLGGFKGPNDGTVAVAETQIEGVVDHLVVPASHAGLLMSAEAARQTANFLREGRFRRGGAEGGT